MKDRVTWHWTRRALGGVVGHSVSDRTCGRAERTWPMGGGAARRWCGLGQLDRRHRCIARRRDVVHDPRGSPEPGRIVVVLRRRHGAVESGEQRARYRTADNRARSRPAIVAGASQRCLVRRARQPAHQPAYCRRDLDRLQPRRARASRGSRVGDGCDERQLHLRLERRPGHEHALRVACRDVDRGQPESRGPSAVHRRVRHHRPDEAGQDHAVRDCRPPVSQPISATRRA